MFKTADKLEGKCTNSLATFGWMVDPASKHKSPRVIAALQAVILLSVFWLKYDKRQFKKLVFTSSGFKIMEDIMFRVSKSELSRQRQLFLFLWRLDRDFSFGSHIRQ